MTDRVIRAADIAADYHERAERYSRRAETLAAAGFPESAETARRRATYHRVAAADYDRIANRGNPVG